MTNNVSFQQFLTHLLLLLLGVSAVRTGWVLLVIFCYVEQTIALTMVIVIPVGLSIPLTQCSDMFVWVIFLSRNNE